MTDAQEIIAMELARISGIDMSEAPPYARASVHTAALHIKRALHAAGYRILGPGELDVETVERCAEVAEKTHYMHSSHQYYRSAAINIAAAIRALTGGKNAQ